MAAAAQTDTRLLGATVLVTGGSAGIGAGCVRCLHDAGAQVVFCSNAPQEGAALAKELGPERVLFVEADCRVEADITRVVATAIEQFGGLDCLVNNVGTHPLSSTIDGFTAEDFRSLLDLNVISPFLFSKMALPHLRGSQRSPSIINIGSMVNTVGQTEGCTYVATKGAVVAFTRALAIDEAPNGVRVNCISPSHTPTPLFEKCSLAAMTDEERANPEAMEKVLTVAASECLLNRVGKPQDVGKACVFLASKDAEFITGIDLFVSGGAELDYGVKAQEMKEFVVR